MASYNAAQLQAAKKARMLLVHPDKVDDDKAAESFQKVIQAYADLTDPTKRTAELNKVQLEANRYRYKESANAAFKVLCAPKAPAAAAPTATSEPHTAQQDLVEKVDGLSTHAHHVRAKVASGFGRNFVFKKAGSQERATLQAQSFLKAVEQAMDNFDSLTNVAGRKEFFQDYGLKFKAGSTIAFLRDSLLRACCDAASPKFEVDLKLVESKALDSQKPHGVNVAQASSGTDIHQKFFQPATLKQPKHPSRPFYLHSGVFAALRSLGWQKRFQGMLVGLHTKSQYRVTHVVVGLKFNAVQDLVQDLLVQHATLGLRVLGIVAAVEGENNDPCVQELDACRTWLVKHALSTACMVYVKLSYSSSPTGSFRVWDVTQDTFEQIHIHLTTRKHAGDSCQLLDLDRSPGDLRSLVLEAFQKHAGGSASAAATAAAQPAQTPAPEANATEDTDVVGTYRIMRANPDGLCFWTSLFFSLTPRLWEVARNPNGIPLAPGAYKLEQEQVRQFRDGVLANVLDELNVLEAKFLEPHQQEHFQSMRARFAQLQAGDEPQLEDLHVMCQLTGNRIRVCLASNVRRVFPSSHHDRCYGRPEGVLEATMLFRFGMDERSSTPTYGHFDAILPAQASDKEVFRMPKHAPMAPSTEAWQFLQELYHPVPTKQEVKREPSGPCKRERMQPEPGVVVDIVDSEEEGDVRAPLVKRAKPEFHGPVRARAACPGEALVVLSDDDAEQILGPNVSPAPLQAGGVESQHTAKVPVLKVRDHWRDLLLSGAKTWELRTFSCEAHQGRIALGYAGLVDGFITFTSCKVVGVRVGNGYTGKPEQEEDFWLAPHNLDKHRATAQDLQQLGGKGKFLYAWVMESPVSGTALVLSQDAVGHLGLCGSPAFNRAVRQHASRQRTGSFGHSGSRAFQRAHLRSPCHREG